MPYELAKRVMDEIISNGRVVRGQLGFVGGENRNRPGIDVSAVAKGSPADIAGIRPGDIIVAIDGVRLESASKTLDMIAETEPGTELEIEAQPRRAFNYSYGNGRRASRWSISIVGAGRLVRLPEYRT